MNEHDQEVVRRFVERARTESAAGLTAEYRVSGGAPGDSVDKRIEFGGDDAVRVRFRDEVVPSRSGEAVSALASDEALRLCQVLAEALPEMMSREEARFLPDALVGSVVIEVDGQATTLFFDADLDDRRARGAEVAPALTEAVQHIDRLAVETLRGVN